MPDNKEPEAFDFVYDGTRNANLQHTPSYDEYNIQASTETGQLTSGLKRTSKTFKWEHKGYAYRVQVQVTKI